MGYTAFYIACEKNHTYDLQANRSITVIDIGPFSFFHKMEMNSSPIIKQFQIPLT